VSRIIPIAWLSLAVSCLALAGCAQAPATPVGGAPPPPEVDVCMPKVEQVGDYEDFPGRIEAVNAVEIRARVTGYLDKVHFREGEEVKKGDLLFEIDSRSYAAELARTEGTITQTERKLKRLEHDYQRATNLVPQRGISPEEFDKVSGDRAEAVGSLKVAKAQRDMAALNMDFTKVRAPLSGKISRRAIDPGNLVKADDTVLTNIVSLDPVYAYFDLDERSMLRAQRLIREGKIKWSLDANLPVYLGLPDEGAFGRQGSIDFADNRVDSDTGTWRVRARFGNADRSLLPGLFVRMRLPIGEAYRAILVSEQALGTDQGQKFVYVIDDAGKVAYRRVKVGRLHNELRVITEGLSETDKVVVSGLQRIRPGALVVAKMVATMPVVSDGIQDAKK
jgi:RND family efflux transporter MFP subunit